MADKLEEGKGKIVSTDGNDEVEVATPEGGSAENDVKKAKVKVNQADKIAEAKDEGDEDEELEEGKKAVKEEDEEGEDAGEEGEGEGDEEGEDDLEEAFSNLFVGQTLSEDFQDRARLVFESAVNVVASKKAKSLAESLEAKFENNLNEAVEEAVSGLKEGLNTYLDYVVTEWADANKLAIESGIKVARAESFMESLKTLFQEHNVQIDENTVDVVAEMETVAEEAVGKANDLINENIELKKQIETLTAHSVFHEVSEGLTLSQVEKLRALSEKLNFKNIENYRADLNTLRESFFKKEKTITESYVEEHDVVVSEEKAPVQRSEFPTVDWLAEAITARMKR